MTHKRIILRPTSSLKDTIILYPDSDDEYQRMKDDITIMMMFDKYMVLRTKEYTIPAAAFKNGLFIMETPDDDKNPV